MRNHILIFISTLFLLFTVTSNYSNSVYGTWSKYGLNPVFNKASSGQWDDLYTLPSHIIFDGTNYTMWYSGANTSSIQQLGIATSSDGISWTRNENNPVLQVGPDGAWDDKSAGEVSIIFDEGIYKMWYSGYTGVGLQYQIGYATSPDGINWTKYANNPVLSPTSSTWDSSAVFQPYVIKNGSTYHMWYSGKSSSHWKLGYATSSDGIQWTKHPSNPVLDKTQSWENVGGDGLGNPTVLYDGTLFHMWYHVSGIGYAVSTNGINWTKYQDNPVVPRGNDGEWDDYFLVTPEVNNNNGQYMMWYGGEPGPDFYDFRIGLATTDSLPEILPTATPTPTPTVFQTPTPTTFSPIIVIPGLGGSINERDIASCSLNQSHEWRLTPRLGEAAYNPLLNALANSGLTRNERYYLYTYDWRQPPDVLGGKFHTYLQQIAEVHPGGTKFQLVGHSLGGIVIRSYLSQYGDDLIEAAITVGTPHQGTPKIYPVWAAGNTNYLNSTWRIAIETLLLYCRFHKTIPLRAPINFPLPINLLSTRRSVIQSQAPIAQTLLPTFDYLKKDGNVIAENTMTNRNTWLPTHSFSQNFISTLLTTISGNGFAAERYFNVTDANRIERRLGDWKDGKIQSVENTNEADGTILLFSSHIEDADTEVLSKNHGGIISSNEGIQTIFSHLNLPTTLVQSLSNSQTEEPTSALIVTVKNGKLSVTNPPSGSFVGESLAILLNPSEGDYGISVLSDTGEKTILGATYLKKNEEEKTNFFPIKPEKRKQIKYRISLKKIRQWLPELFLSP